MARVIVKFDERKVLNSFERSYRDAQFYLTEAVYTDSDPYVPMDSGDLKGQVERSGDRGEVVYNMEYAAAQYYGLPNKKRGQHPQATSFWFEFAKRAKGSTWLRKAKQIAGSR